MSALRRIRPAQLLMVAFALIGIGVLTFALRDVVREAVVIPLAYAVWLTDLLLRSLPQGLFLALLLIVSTVIVLRGLLRAGVHTDAASFNLAASSPRSRLGFWMRQLHNLERSRFAREQTAQEVRNLILRTLAQTYQIEPNEAMARVRDGAIGLPPEIEALLRHWQSWMDVERSEAAPLPARLWQRLRAALSSARRSPNDTAVALDNKLKAAIDYVETQLGNST